MACVVAAWIGEYVTRKMPLVLLSVLSLESSSCRIGRELPDVDSASLVSSLATSTWLIHVGSLAVAGMAENVGKTSCTRQKRSSVWAYLEETGDGTAKCNLCNQAYVRTSGTTNLFNHLKSHHKKEHAAAVGEALPSSKLKSGDVVTCVGTKPVGSFFQSNVNRPCNSARAGAISELILDWVVDSTRPLSVVSDPAFI